MTKRINLSRAATRQPLPRWFADAYRKTLEDTRDTLAAEEREKRLNAPDVGGGEGDDE